MDTISRARVLRRKNGCSGQPGLRPRRRYQRNPPHRRRSSALSIGQNSEEARELAMIAVAIQAYEQKRSPDGKVPGGKG